VDISILLIHNLLFTHSASLFHPESSLFRPLTRKLPLFNLLRWIIAIKAQITLWS